MSGSPAPSGPLGPIGNGEKPQLPVTSVVTPWNALLSPPGIVEERDVRVGVHVDEPRAYDQSCRIDDARGLGVFEPAD